MKKIFLLLTLLSTSLTLSAAPIGEARAREIAEAFFAQNATTRSSVAIELEWAGESISAPVSRANDIDDALIYIYTRGDNDGFVIIAGDDSIAPIIAYSFDTTLDSENMADATKAIIDAWGAQVKAARDGSLQISATTHATTRYSGELLYDTPLWDQGDPYNREAPRRGGGGSRAQTGCVATAMAIICYYNKWPEKGVGTTPEYTYKVNNGSYTIEYIIDANTLGRTYDYNNMLADYSNGFSDAQANAVAALMKDMGTAVQMEYGPTGSGAYTEDVPKAFVDHFSYSDKCYLAYRYYYVSDEWHNIMRENLNNFGPTFYRGRGDSGGHAFVVDGYSPGDYFHFNFGWGGSGNGYFLFPEIKYYDGQAALLNLEPDKDGTSKSTDDIQLYAFFPPNRIRAMTGMYSYATKYVTNCSFTMDFGGFINKGLRAFSGEIALVHCNKDGEWREQLYTVTVENLGIDDFYYEENPIEITIGTIEEGDLLRVYYKSIDSDEWIWARVFINKGDSSGPEADDEILICATPEQVAENLQFKYYKESNVIYLECSDAWQVDVDNGKYYQELEEKGQISISGQFLGKGEHIIKVSCSGRPYELKVKL